MRICILYSPTGNGHRSAARAIEQALAREAPHAHVDVLDVLRFAPSSFRYDRLWELIQQHGGRFYDRLFAMSDRPSPILRRVRDAANLRLLAPLADELERVQPDHIICTHYLPAVAVAHLKRTRRITGRTSVVITDYLAHEAWLFPGIDRYYVASPRVAEQLLARGTRGIEITGIPIGREMDEAPVPPPAIGRVLFLAAGVPHRLVHEALASMGRQVDLDIVCGGNAALRDELALHRARVHGFVPGLRSMIDRADVVVTKAGGLVVSECIARGRAMVLPFPAPGQEAGNRTHAIAIGAARACEPHEVGAVLEAIPALAMGAAAARAAKRHAATHIARDLTRHARIALRGAS